MPVSNSIRSSTDERVEQCHEVNARCSAMKEPRGGPLGHTRCVARCTESKSAQAHDMPVVNGDVKVVELYDYQYPIDRKM